MIHHLYRPGNNYDFDVAVLILSCQLKFNELVQPIHLTSFAPKKGTPALVSGLGHTVSGGQGGNANDLQAAEVYVFSYEECRKGYGEIIKERMVCVGCCQNDSGDPLVSNGELIGIVSSADKGYPGMHASIANLCHWLVEIINKKINKFIVI